jgi:hypothetical protein
MKDEYDDFKKLELHSNSSDQMDVDKSQKNMSDKPPSSNSSPHVNRNAGKFKKMKGSYHNLFK